MTRKQLRYVISEAHIALHANDLSRVHEILHVGVQVEDTESMTADPEVQTAVASLLEYQKGKLGCGHTIGDLISGKGMVTKCGACLAERQPKD